LEYWKTVVQRVNHHSSTPTLQYSGLGTMPDYTDRFYRKRVKSEDLVSFEVMVKETDLLVSAERTLDKETRDLVFESRHQIESYIQTHSDFLTALEPYPEDPYAPPLVREMIECSRAVGVGPMASVAGAIAEYVGRHLLKKTKQVIVENGGDLFIKADRPVTVSLFAGTSPLSERIGLVISPALMPLGVASSSGTVGHSLSLGKADAGCVVSPSATLADAAATALCNRVQGPKDLSRIDEWAGGLKGILGVVVILGDKMASWGQIELVAL
jgi:ApbE superfamily uncharacterized protein (UPF0280 family)